MRKLAKDRGGACLSRKYTNSRNKLKWQCAHGHTFKINPRVALAGQWCPDCAKQTKRRRRQVSFADALEKAHGAGGRHVGETTILSVHSKWCCANGHEFVATGKSILARNFFCPNCDKTTVTIKDVQQECTRRSGYCLSADIEHLSSELEFMCHRGHTWRAQWKNVGLRGSWCPSCVNIDRRLDSARRLAIRRGGQLINSAWPTDPDPLLGWRCQEGHHFLARALHARRRWCPQCKHDSKPQTSRLKHVSCEHGHVWAARAEYAMSADDCPACLNGLPSCHPLVAIAVAHGGSLLSTVIVGKDPMLRWRCKHEHEFLATPAAAAQDWCLKCSGPTQIAKRHEGECLNAEGTRWKCKFGHEFYSSQSDASLNWCPHCEDARERVVAGYARMPNGLSVPTAPP